MKMKCLKVRFIESFDTIEKDRPLEALAAAPLAPRPEELPI